MVTDKYYQFCKSVIGFSHRIRNLPCQDACAIRKIKEQNLMVIAVADGHGSEPLSQFGSRFAVESACDNIACFVKELKGSSITKSFNSLTNSIYCRVESKVKNNELTYLTPVILDNNGYKKIIDENNIIKSSLKEYETANSFFQALNNLEKLIISNWYDKVITDFSSRKEKLVELNLKQSDYDNPSHLYGTTLLASAVTKEYWFAIQIGDGTCFALFDENKYSNELMQINRPIPDDERCYRNVTTSLCDSEPCLDFRQCFGTKPPKAIFLGSDGIENSFPSENREQELENLRNYYSSLIKKIINNKNSDLFEKELKELNESEEGSGDDSTIAGLIHYSWIKSYISKGDRTNKDKNKKRKRRYSNWLSKLKKKRNKNSKKYNLL